MAGIIGYSDFSQVLTHTSRVGVRRGPAGELRKGLPNNTKLPDHLIQTGGRIRCQPIKDQVELRKRESARLRRVFPAVQAQWRPS